MTLLLNTTALAQPSSVNSQWITVDGVLLRQVVLRYDAIAPAACRAILALCGAGQSVNLTYHDPSTNATAALAVRLYAAAVVYPEEVAGTLTYAPAEFEFRTVPPAA